MMLVRDVLGLARNAREAKRVISQKKIEVDATPRHDHKFQVGLMDSVSIPEMDLHLRIVPDPRSFLKPISIEKEEARKKIVKIGGKTTFKGGKIQITSHDGRNFLVVPGTELATTRVGDSLFIELPTQEIVEVLPLRSGATGLVLRGKGAGRLGTIKKAEGLLEVQDLEEGPELIYRVLRRNILVVGEGEPPIRVR